MLKNIVNPLKSNSFFLFGRERNRKNNLLKGTFKPDTAEYINPFARGGRGRILLCEKGFQMRVFLKMPVVC
jgi:hypothetical protein